MRLVMTLLVRDEVDIVRQNIAFHLQHGVDAIVATDNGSSDGTREALAQFAAQGVLRIIDEPGDDYSQHRWVTRMAHLAADEHGADWILNNDADEFWVPESGDLKTGLAGVVASMVACRTRHMLFAHDCPPSPTEHGFADIVHRVRQPLPRPALSDFLTDALPVPFYYLDLRPKVLCRARGLREVHQGNHGASYLDDTREASQNIAIYHYPVRSFDHFVRKIACGGAAYARNSTLPVETGWQWRRWYRMLSSGHAVGAFREALPSAARLEDDLISGHVIVDTTLRDRLCASP